MTTWNTPSDPNHRDRRSQEALFSDNVRLAYDCIRRFRGLYNAKRGYDFDDMLQEALMALNRASKSFNPELGYRFSTFAYRAIWLAVGREADRQCIALGHKPRKNVTRYKKQVPTVSLDNMMDPVGIEGNRSHTPSCLAVEHDFDTDHLSTLQQDQLAFVLTHANETVLEAIQATFNVFGRPRSVSKGQGLSKNAFYARIKGFRQKVQRMEEWEWLKNAPGRES